MDRLDECLDSVKSTVRNTNERVLLLLKCSEVASGLGLITRSKEIAREAAECTKGLPSVDEEPRYYAALEVAGALHMRVAWEARQH